MLGSHARRIFGYRMLITTSTHYGESLIGAKINELEERDALGRVLVLERVAEGIRRAAQEQPRFSGSLERFHRWQEGGLQEPERGRAQAPAQGGS